MIVDKANIIKDFYLETFKPVAFGSANELGSEEDIILNDAMKEQMKNFGEWRNTADGTGLIFGIVFNDGSFGPIKNSNGDYLQFNFDDTSLLIPGTEIEYDPEIRTKTQLLQPRRAYPYVPKSVQKKQENEGTIIRSGSRTQKSIMAQLGFGLNINKTDAETGYDQYQVRFGENDFSCCRR